MKFTAVIVTYANRGKLLKQVVDECIKSGCDSFFIVDNGSATESKETIAALVTKYKNIIFHVIVNNENMGSAFAFSQGMDASASDKNKNEHILFLDDDNVADVGSIQNALLISERNEKNNVYFLLRTDRQHYIKYANTLDDVLLIGKKNSFLTFTVMGFFKRLIKKITKQTIDEDLNKDLPEKIPTPCGPYGGMLTKKSILIGGIRPLVNMYLYFDDTNYTMDLKKSGVNLWLLPNCKLNDIDISWTNEKPKSIFSSPLFEASDYKIKYTLRNRVFFELRHLVTCKTIYIINIILFMLIHFLKAILSGNIKKYLALFKYIYDGFHFNGGYKRK